MSENFGLEMQFSKPQVTASLGHTKNRHRLQNDNVDPSIEVSQSNVNKSFLLLGHHINDKKLYHTKYYGHYILI